MVPAAVVVASAATVVVPAAAVVLPAAAVVGLDVKGHIQINGYRMYSQSITLSIAIIIL